MLVFIVGSLSVCLSVCLCLCLSVSLFVLHVVCRHYLVSINNYIFSLAPPLTPPPTPHPRERGGPAKPCKSSPFSPPHPPNHHINWHVTVCCTRLQACVDAYGPPKMAEPSPASHRHVLLLILTHQFIDTWLCVAGMPWFYPEKAEWKNESGGNLGVGNICSRVSDFLQNSLRRALAYPHLRMTSL